MLYENIGVIGTGRLGSAIAIALKFKGYDITGLYSSGGASQRKLCSSLDIELENSFSSSVLSSNIILITVPDSQIGLVSERISKEFRSDELKGKIFLHMSGSITSDALVEISQMGACVGSLHPIQTFADIANGWRLLEGIYFGYEGSEHAKVVAQKFVESFNGHMLILKKEDKPLYHACACVLSNYIATLCHLGEKLMDSFGMDKQTGMKAFMPLVMGSIENISRMGSIQALTGPISRGDLNVIEHHIDAMDKKVPHAQWLYGILGKETVKIALERQSIDSETATMLNNILDKTKK